MVYNNSISNDWDFYTPTQHLASSEDDPFGLMQPELDLPMPQLVKVAQPAIHQVSEAFAVQEDFRHLAKRVKQCHLIDLELPTTELECIEEVAKTRKSGRSIFTEEQDTQIARFIKDHYFYQEIANELGCFTAAQIRHRWNVVLSKRYPFKYDPLDKLKRPLPNQNCIEEIAESKIRAWTIFTEEQDTRIANLIEMGYSYQRVADDLKQFNANQIRKRWNSSLSKHYPFKYNPRTEKRMIATQPAPVLLLPIDPRAFYLLQNACFSTFAPHLLKKQ